MDLLHAVDGGLLMALSLGWLYRGTQRGACCAVGLALIPWISGGVPLRIVNGRIHGDAFTDAQGFSVAAAKFAF